ncbi:alpha/beta hydrolase [Microbispora sp. H10885]|uniref:alpha/beta hydrolase n=1 Tax=Microbispora sp. H10885 TaxID=2729110 RepID=UPI0028737304|nr:alpha/beta hydrolase [Microbispora sp. H10885]
MGTAVRTAMGMGAAALAALMLTSPGARAATVAATVAAAPAGNPAPQPSATPVPSASPVSSASATPSAPPTPSASASPSASPTPPAGARMHTYSYGPHPRQIMDVWWHPTGPRRPAVFVIHGGWWSGGDKKYMTSVTRYYVQQGYTVVNLDYRLSGDAPWPAQRTDVLSAVAAVRRHPALFNTDPGRYVLLGFSAGGHLAAAVGTYGDGRPGLRGVVGISPPVSPLSAYEDGTAAGTFDQRKLRRAAVRLAGGCSPARCPRVWSSMEVPFHATPGDAPMLAVHSADEFVPPYQSEVLKESLENVGVPMTVKTMAGTFHSAPLYREPGVPETVRAWIAARLAQPAR